MGTFFEELYEAKDEPLDYGDFWETVWQSDAAALADLLKDEPEAGDNQRVEEVAM